MNIPTSVHVQEPAIGPETGIVARLSTQLKMTNGLTKAPTVTNSNAQSGIELAKAIESLARAIEEDASIRADARDEMLRSLSNVREQAETPEDQRSPGILKPSLRSLANGQRLSADAAKVWDVVGPAIAEHFKNLLG